MEDKQKQLYKKPKIEIYGNLKKITNKTEGPQMVTTHLEHLN